MKNIFLRALLLVLSFLWPFPVAQAQDKHLVVAHWLVPMPYKSGERPDQSNKDDVRAAMEMGIDGFAIDAFSGTQAKNTIAAFIEAADEVGAPNFKLFLSADMSLGFKAEDIVSTIKNYGHNPHYLTMAGKPLLSTYGGDKLGEDWWQTQVIAPLKEAGTPVTFIPYFDRKNPNADKPTYNNWMQIIQSHPSADGLFNFLMPGSTPFYSNDPHIGHHWWSIMEADEALSKALKDSGKLYMAPFMPYYWAVCHPVRQYMEHQGGRGMDNWWTSIITKQNPDIVEIVTWNDYSESSYIQPTRIPSTKTPGIPSTPHLGYYELMKYYISWYKTGHKPTLTKDGIFAFYRLHPDQAMAPLDQAVCPLGPIPPSQKWGEIKNSIYVTTTLATPAQLVVRTGTSQTSYNLEAGLTTTEIPFQAGRQSFELWRNGKQLTALAGQDIVARPDIYNYNVYSAYAIAGGSRSATWQPSEAWKSSSTADWFSQP